MPIPKYLTINVLLIVAIFSVACHKQDALLIDKVETLDSQLSPLHIAYIKIQPNDKRHYNVESCFYSEPGIEFYNTVETHRIFRDRDLVIDNIADERDPKAFEKLRDFDILLISLPRGETVLLRSFSLKERTMRESFAPKTKFTCEQVHQWQQLVKVVSFPDNGFIFIDKNYAGKTPRWLRLEPGQHTVQVELYEGIIGKTKISIPGASEVIIKDGNADVRGTDDFGEIKNGRSLEIGTMGIVSGILGIAAVVVPIIIFF